MKSLELVQRYLLIGCLLAVGLMPVANKSQPVDVSMEDTDDSVASHQGNASQVIFDQRQSGKYNIRISIKDVAIIEMDQNGFGDGSFDDDDYYYDDADLTVKPIKLTTPKPQNATASDNHTVTNLTTSSTPTTTKTPPTTADSPLSHPAYSPNLLADIAAASKPSTSRISTRLTTPFSSTSSNKTPNVVIIETTPEYSTTTPLPFKGFAARSKHIPVHLMLPEQTQDTETLPTNSLQQELQRAERFRQAEDNSKIFNFKMPPSHRPLQTGRHVRACRLNQYRDSAGNCRVKRSSSFLRKLFSMFAAFPFARIEREHVHDNE